MVLSHVDDLALMIRELNDADIDRLVSLLSSDYSDGTASSMMTMQYIFNTSPQDRHGRAPTALRVQAKGCAAQVRPVRRALSA